MGFFKKKKEAWLEQDIPQLPELPEHSQIAFLPKSEIPDVPSGLQKIETNALPMLPNSDLGDKFNQEAIKEAIGKPEEKLSKSVEQIPGSVRHIPTSIKHPLTREVEEKKTLEIPSVNYKRTQMPQEYLSPPKQKKINEPVFIRLDKFRTTTETFDSIKEKVEEIENLLKKTREIKIQEEKELAEWEREIQIIKSRIDLIDRTIFDKLGEN